MSVHQSKQNKFVKDKSLVGPGAYTLPHNDIIKFKNPQWTIRNKQTIELDKSSKEFPGPTSYNTTKKSKAPLFTMGMRFRTLNMSTDSEKVGPGSYNTTGK